MTGPESARLAAFARDCVQNGDMTPCAERMLLRIMSSLSESESEAGRNYCNRCGIPHYPNACRRPDDIDTPRYTGTAGQSL